jgi:DmsE family decaheme c-type cytochrome
LVAASLLLLPIRSSWANGPQDKPAAPTSTEPAQYVGSEVCKTCHEDLYKNNFERTPHFKTTLKDGHGCESCHGPGSEHVASGGEVSKIISFKALSKPEASARCLTCHAESHQQRDIGSSSHASNNVGCLDCHSPHFAQEPQHLLIAAQPNLCYGCHLSTKAEFGLPYRHRVNEHLVECADCHNVHGTTTLRQVRALPQGDAVCFKCHADKQGPFIYEHEPVRTEGCTSCHSPHGSTNPRLLLVSQVNLLCLQCHTFPMQGPAGPTHNQASKYQACTLCHQAIHGSNYDPAFFK